MRATPLAAPAPPRASLWISGATALGCAAVLVALAPRAP